MIHDPEDVILDSALALPHSERPAFLDHACANDPRLRHLVEGLLLAHEHALAPRGTQGGPAPGPTLPASLEKPGGRIGRYKLLQQIGEGGWGVVYMAEQEEPVRRRVALKVIKPGMDTKQVLGRFEAERQALALMDHPNIAKVHDGGATDNGRPYFVMELVRGIKITDYCDQHQLPTAKRLELFVSVCKAIQHAHQKGIIHRDIKPSNILVTLHDPDSSGVPKVIDFGIAKATEQRLTDKTLFTALNQFIGTPAYMSPEQAEMTGLDIDTRSDIYSLGVLLYELLTGQTPFDPKEMAAAGLDGVRKLIREKDPLKPSTRLRTLTAAEQTTVARCRQLDPPKLIHLVRGDLDWIVMKCLEKDRTRRYETANGLAFDVLRYLNNEPVLARPASTVYRFRKLVGRHKLAFASAAAIASSVLIGLAVSTSLWLQEREDRRRATASEQAQIQEANHARAAEADAREQLWHSYLAQAQAGRWSHRAGARFNGLDLVRKAAAMRPSLELRNEAIALIALPDVRLVKEWPDQGDPKQPCLGFDYPRWRYAHRAKNGDVVVRSLDDDRELVHLPGAHSPGDFIFSPSGRLMAAFEGTGESIKPVRVWDLERATPILSVTNDFIRYPQFTADESLLALAEFPGAIHLYDLRVKQEIKRFPTGGIPYALSFHPDGQTLAVSLTDSPIVELFDVTSGALRKKLTAPSPINNVDWHPEGKWLAASAHDGNIYILDVVSGSPRAVLRKHESAAIGAGFSHSGELLTSVGWDGQLRIWDLFNEDQICSQSVIFGGALSPDEHWLSTSSRPGVIGLLEVATAQECRLLNAPEKPGTWACTFSPDGRLLASAHRDGVRVWNPRAHSPAALLSIGDTPSVSFLAGSSSLLTSGAAGLVKWEIDPSFPATNPPATLPASRTLVPAAHDRMSCDSNSQFVAFLSRGQVHILDLASEQERHPLTANVPFTVARLSPDARWCAASPNNTNQVWVFALKNGGPPRFLAATNVNAMAFSPDSDWFATGDPSSYHVWETATWRQTVYCPRGTGQYIGGTVGFSPDSRMVAVSSTGQLIALLDPASGREFATLEPRVPQNIAWFAFSPDGAQLAVAAWGQTIQLWDLRLIRSELAAINLDWDLPPYPPPSQASSQPASR
jgi:serine/threonine protein kinase/WD40 repeat protein